MDPEFTAFLKFFPFGRTSDPAKLFNNHRLIIGKSKGTLLCR